MRRDRRPVAGTLIALGAGAALLGLGACTSSGSGAPTAQPSDAAPVTVPATVASAPGSGAASTSTSTSTTPGPTRSSAGRTSSLPTTDPSALSTVPTAPVRTLHAVPLSSPAPFGTGVSARVLDVTHGIDHDRGPGAAAGRPTVLFHLRLTNGTTKPVSVADVQVLATYGSSATPAIAATSATRPFTGTLRPGRSAAAVYAFAVPSSGQGDVAVTVTYTAGRPTVLLTGSAR